MLKKELESIKRENLYRTLPDIEFTDSSNYIFLDGKPVLNACSNNYLGLTHNKEIQDAMAEATARFGSGSGASRLVSGNHGEYRKAERELVSFFGLDDSFASLVVGNGYCCNVGLLSALGSMPDTEFFMDKLCHASLIDGSELSGAKRKRYRHNDVSHLKRLLKESTAKNRTIVTDGVFSMDGDLAPLRELIEAKKESNAILILDDAHGVGVLGEKGRGIAEELDVDIREIDALVGTFGKAFGLYGAYVVARKEMVEFMVNRARSVIFSTGLPPAILAGISASLRIVAGMDKERKHLREQSVLVRNKLQSMDFEVPDGISPIIPIIAGSNEKALELAQRCRGNAVFVPAIRPPAVPKNTARLRLTLSSAFTAKEITAILEAFPEK